MKRKRSGRPHGAALLLVSVLAGCAQHPSQSAPMPKATTPNEGHSAMQQRARAIVYLQHSATDSDALSSAIAEACRCQPVLFRSYLEDALIYEIALPQELTFAVFAEALMRDAARLGIKAVEQDRVMQHR
jgi:hypothetical protein